MAVEQSATKITPPRRGRPRVERATGLVRRNLVVDAWAIEQLRALYGATSDSDAVRQVVEAALMVEQARALREWLATRGGSVDAYGRTTERGKLPVQLTDDDAVDCEDDAPGCR